MPYIQLNDRQLPLPVGAVRIGTGPDAHVRLPGADGGLLALIELAPDLSAAIRRGSEKAVVRVNGVQLGVEPSPLLHGDKIEVAGLELLYGDDKKGGSTQFVSSSDLAVLQQQYASTKAAKPTASTGGRLVSLVDGREYAVPAGGLVIGRDAGCDVVVPSTEVSRRHAEIAPSPTGYLITDKSTNGVLVNGQRVVQTKLLGRSDVLRIGNEEFRFYADAASVPASAPQPSTAAPLPPPSAAASAAVTPLPLPPAVAATSASSPLTATVPPGGGRPALATLEGNGTRHELRVPLVQVGRGAHNDVVLADDSVSDSHAKIQKRAGGWFVVDMGSTNGTYVGGRRVDGEAPLAPGADVRFGAVRLQFRPTGAAEGPNGTRAIPDEAVQEARRIGRDAAPERPAAERPSAARVPADRVPVDRAAVERASAPAAVAPPSRGLPSWIWIVALVLVAAAAYFIYKGR